MERWKGKKVKSNFALIKFFCALLAAMIFPASSISFAEESANEKLIQIERDTYGAEQTGAILSRISKLEKDYTGKNMQGNMNARIDAIYNLLYEDTGEASIIAKVNALEWNVSHEVKSGGIDNRIFLLEDAILGKTETGTFFSRIRQLSKESFGTENIPMMEEQIPENILIKVSLTEDVGSKTLHVGDTVNFQVAEDVIIDNKLIFAKGLRGEGTVTNVRKAQGWLAKKGKIEIDFNKVRCLDGRTIETFVGEEAKQAMIENKMLAGANLVGMDLNSDWVKAMRVGRNIEINEGTEFYIQTKNLSAVYILPIDSGALTATENITPADENSSESDEVFEVD